MPSRDARRATSRWERVTSWPSRSSVSAGALPRSRICDKRVAMVQLVSMAMVILYTNKRPLPKCHYGRIEKDAGKLDRDRGGERLDRGGGRRLRGAGHEGERRGLSSGSEGNRQPPDRESGWE